MNQKGFLSLALLTIVVVLIALGAGYWFWTQEPSAESVTELSTLPGDAASTQPTATSPTPMPKATQPSPTSVPAQNAEMANWKAYVNTKYQFEFAYPETWVNREGGSSQSDVEFIMSRSEPCPQSCLAGNTPSLTIQFLNQNIEQFTAGNTRSTIGTHVAYTSPVSGNIEGGANQTIYISLPQGTLAIFTEAIPQKQLGQILSTFSFGN